MNMAKPKNTKRINQYGLTRHIDADVKREIRQRCKFGCAICGLGIYEYEHVDPEFHEAKAHVAKNMTLLCPSCHAKVTRRIWSKSKVKRASENPYCVKQGYSNESFDLGNEPPFFTLGGVTFKEVTVPIMVKGTPLFKVAPPENPGEPFRFSGFFTDLNGEVSLEIIENEWRASTDNWDVEIVGNTITIREKLNKIHLRMTAHPPDGLTVSKLDMSYEGMSFKGDAEKLTVTFKNGSTFDFINGRIEEGAVGLSFS